MSLSDSPTAPPSNEDPQETQTSKSKTQTSKATSKLTPKLAQAVEIAKKYTNLPYPAARSRIMEETPCSKSVAHRAYHLLKKQMSDHKEKTSEKDPAISIVDEPDTAPAFIDQDQKPSEPETITEIEAAPVLAVTDEDKEALDLFQDMLRGTYTMLFSREGLLGEKYGRTTKQCENLADMQFRWLIRRYSATDLQKFDTILLVGAYGTMFAGIAKEYMAERKKKKAEKRAD